MNTTTIPDTGSISVTISDATAVVPWQSGSTAQGIATQLQSQLQQAGGGFLQVTRSGSTLSLSSSIASADANWPILYSITDTSSQTPSFTLSDTGMSGGSNPTVVAPTVSPGATLLYSYSIPAFNPSNMAASGYLANGNLQNVTDSVMGNWSYQYDDLNRLKQANASANPQTGFAPYGAAQLNWGYDSFGDYKGTTLSGSTGFSMPQVAYSYNGTSLQNGTALTGVANNRIDGYNYDASGDLLSDALGGQNYYVYDAEGRVSTVGGSVKYVYDAEGRRVAKESVSGGSATITNHYVLGLGGEQVSELNGSGSWVHSNVYAGGKLLATYNPTGLHFHFTDWLGTNRIQTSGTGMLEESCMSLPFGDMLNCSGSDSTEQHFTGQIHDAESGLDYFSARYYESSAGRWMSPDWAAKAEPIPYAKFDNPQSLNLYQYVGNNPLSIADADGHDWWDTTKKIAKAAKDSFYLKVESGVGLEVHGKGLFAKAQLGVKSVQETNAKFDNKGTVKKIDEASAKIKAGPISIGPSISKEQTIQTGNGPKNYDAPSEVHGNVIYDTGKGGTGSNGEIGLGIGGYVGVGGGLEVGFDTKELVQGIKEAFSSDSKTEEKKN